MPRIGIGVGVGLPLRAPPGAAVPLPDLVRTVRLGVASNTGGSTASFETPSFTPSDDSVLIAVVSAWCDNDPSSADFNISGGGLTWTKRASVDIPGGSAYANKQQIFTAPVSSGAPMTLTVDHPSATIHVWNVFAVDYINHNAASPVGATGSAAALADGAASFDLDADPAASSETLAARAACPNEGVDEAATPGAGWTELYDLADPTHSGWGGAQVQARAPGSTSAAVAWADTLVNGTLYAAGGLAIEIRKAGTGAYDDGSGGEGSGLLLDGSALLLDGSQLLLN